MDGTFWNRCYVKYLCSYRLWRRQPGNEKNERCFRGLIAYWKRREIKENGTNFQFTTVCTTFENKNRAWKSMKNQDIRRYTVHDKNTICLPRQHLPKLKRSGKINALRVSHNYFYIKFTSIFLKIQMNMEKSIAHTKDKSTTNRFIFLRKNTDRSIRWYHGMIFVFQI